ncbi:MAG: hypothetical protein ACJ77Z_05700, partial [Thermoleophilaceae bacterium]
MTAPAAGVDFDRNRLSQGELIAGIAGLVLLIDLWFKWYGVKVSGAGGVLKNFSIGVSANAWESFGFIDILLFLIALIAIGVAVLRAIDRMPDMPYPPATLVTGAGALALLLILFRIIDTPVDTHGVDGIDVTRKIGVWLGLLAAAGITYGGWRAMQEGPGATFTSPSAAGGTPTSPTAPTTAMPADDAPGVPGGGAAGVSPGKEGPGAPHPGTSTGAPGEAGEAPPPAAGDPVPGSTAPQTP